MARGLFSNPLFDVLAATTIASNLGASAKAAQAQAMQPDQQSLAFANAAYQQGNLVDQVPRPPGLFSNLGVRIGLLTPNVSPRAKDTSAELGALTDRRKEQADLLGKEIDWRVKTGWQNTENLESLPSVRQMNMFATGGQPFIDLSGPTPREQLSQQAIANRQLTREIELTRLHMATTEMDARMLELQRKLAEPPKYSSAWFDANRKAQYESSAAHEAGVTDTMMGNWSDYDRHFPNAQFRNVDTGYMINRSDKRWDTPAKALADKVNVVRLGTPQAIKAANDWQEQRVRLLDLYDNVLPKVFKDAAGMSALSRTGHIIWNDLWSKFAYANPDVVKYNSMISDSIQYGHALQGRAVNLWEAKQIQKTNFPNLRVDDLANARQKIKDMLKYSRVSAGFAMRETGMGDVTDSATSDFMRDSGGSSDSGSIFGGSSSVPAGPVSVPGTEALEKAAGEPDEGSEMYKNYFGGEGMP